MKYKNTTLNGIFVKIDGETQFIQPGQEVTCNSPLVSSGLTSCEVADPTPPPPVTKKEETPKPKPKTVKTNERKQFTNTDSSED